MPSPPPPFITTPPQALHTSIYLVGPESTGKTTLFTALSSHLSLSPPQLIPEVARALLHSQHWTGSETQTLFHQRAILHATLEEEERREGTVLSDRCALDCVAYAKLGGEDGWEELMKEVLERGAVERYRRGLVVLFEPPAEGRAEEDGARNVPRSLGEWW